VFLENVVTNTWLFEGDGRIQEYVGTDFERWTRRAAASPPNRLAIAAAAASRPKTASAPPKASGAPARRKLSFKEQRELAELPARLEALEAEARALDERVAGPGFYKEPALGDSRGPRSCRDREGEIDALFARWQELEARAVK
jgi:ATP-binding cassette subfamily F protein uup